MDGDMYDEFGNYIGPELESDEEEEQAEQDDEPEYEVKWVCILVLYMVNKYR